METNNELIEKIKRFAIKLGDSMSLARAEIVLTEAREKNINGYVVLYKDNQPMKFYSKFNSIDDLYKEFYGMTKSEWETFKKEQDAKFFGEESGEKLVRDSHKESAVCLGDSMSLARAEIVLTEAREKNINGYVVLYKDNQPMKFYSKFNGVDDLYKEFYGMTKAEWDAFKKEQDAKLFGVETGEGQPGNE